VRALTEQQAYLVNNILSDDSARAVTFGRGGSLYISGHTVAAKTGTTNDNRDNWTFGYTPAHEDSKAAVAISVWIGNNDNVPMNPGFRSTGGAARIWHLAMADYLSNKPDVSFKRPKGIVSGRVDALSGMAPGPYTTATETDIFIEGTVPTTLDNWHIRLNICKPDGKLASEACIAAGQSEERSYIKIRAEKPEWQDDVNAWVAKVYKGKSQYFPPKTTSELCFSEGSVVSCTDPGAGPIITEADVSFRSYPSGPTALDKDLLPSNFAVWVTPTPQPGAAITFVRFSLSGTDCTDGYPNECNRSVSGGGIIEEWRVTTSTCGEGCYSSKDNTSFPFFQMTKEDACVSESYLLKIEVEDLKGGKSTLEIPITIACT
jgi:hypothetical protein